MYSFFCPNTNIANKFKKSINWIENNTVLNKGIVVTSADKTLSYPEVTGYYIPTLLNFGKTKLAIQYADWLISIQNQDGSWSDPLFKSPYIFDSGQILKGLVALYPQKKEYKDSIIKGCNWILSQTEETGQIKTPDISEWSLPKGNVVPEAAHLYTLEPIIKAGNLFEIQEFISIADKSVNYYLNIPFQIEFNTLSHFHAYVMEALVDLGYIDNARKAMKQIDDFQDHDGFVRAYNDEKWICSTGLFQYAIVWYKLGEIKKANLAFKAALTLQNKSGGFYGSYGKDATYFPDKEISWAVKYFLDALYLKLNNEPKLKKIIL